MWNLTTGRRPLPRAKRASPAVLLAFSVFAVVLACPRLLGEQDPEPPATGKISISGRVVDATDTTRGIAAVPLYVYVPHRPSTQGAFDVSVPIRPAALAEPEPAASAVSAEDGSYALKDLPTGKLQMLVDPPKESGYARFELDMTVSGTADIGLDIKLLPTELAAKVAKVVLIPGEVTIAAGATKQFRAIVLGKDVAGLNVSPTWTVEPDTIGVVDADGRFTAGHREEEGVVVATVGEVMEVARVSVVSPPLPPPENHRRLECQTFVRSRATRCELYGIGHHYSRRSAHHPLCHKLWRWHARLGFRSPAVRGGPQVLVARHLYRQIDGDRQRGCYRDCQRKH